MSEHPPGELSTLLDAIRAGDESAEERLFRLIYDELRQMARRMLRRERPDHSLQPSALVHEMMLRFRRGDTLLSAPDRSYLFAAAARAMRQVLVDHARRRRASKRSGPGIRIPLDEALAQLHEQGVDVIDLHEALAHLTQKHPRPARVVELKFFGGLSIPEIALVVQVSDTTVEADWRFARAWLRGRLGGKSA
jgi:RNA polymerase sigma factor (TIGR02999 family)